jgi:enoyl-CoA hydratase
MNVLIIKGAGRAFCAACDIGVSGDVVKTQMHKTGSTDRERLIRSGERWLTLWSMPKPTIAQVHGYCLAGANEIAGMCDLVIAAEDAIFGQLQEKRLGLAVTLGLRPLLLGMRKAKELLFTGDPISGKEAEQIRLKNKAVPTDKLEQGGREPGRKNSAYSTGPPCHGEGCHHFLVTPPCLQLGMTK